MTVPSRAPFVAATASLAAVFVASGMPIPLDSLYRADDGLTDAALATATAAYLAATACALLLLGRLSDHLGRRPVAIAAVLTALVGAVLLLTVDGLPHLLVGRVLQGVACGLASSAIGTLVVDTAPARRRWLAGVLVSTMPPAAVPAGALISGALSQAAPFPRTLSLGLAIGRWRSQRSPSRGGPRRPCGARARCWPSARVRRCRPRPGQPCRRPPARSWRAGASAASTRRSRPRWR